MDKYKKLKLYYHILLIIGLLSFLEIIFKGQIPFIASHILYPFLDSFLSKDVTFLVIGVYSSLYIPFFIAAFLLSKDIKKIEKENNLEKKSQSKFFKIFIKSFLIILGLIILFGFLSFIFIK